MGAGTRPRISDQMALPMTDSCRTDEGVGNRLFVLAAAESCDSSGGKGLVTNDNTQSPSHAEGLSFQGVAPTDAFPAAYALLVSAYCRVLNDLPTVHFVSYPISF